MKIVDANVILRFLLYDVEELSAKAANILEENIVFMPVEVIAEIIYVLEKVYNVENAEISDTIIKLIQSDNIEVLDFDVIEEALELYGRRKFSQASSFSIILS